MSLILRRYSQSKHNLRTLLIRPSYYSTSRTPANKIKENEETNNTPIPYFGTRAQAWTARKSRSGGAEEALSYQPYVISASLAIFLLYFCVFREENDIDEKLSKSLFDHVEGMEEAQLIMIYKYNIEKGLDVGDIEKRLNELGIDVKKM